MPYSGAGITGTVIPGVLIYLDWYKRVSQTWRLKQQKSISPQFWRPVSDIRVSAGLVSSEGYEGRMYSRLLCWVCRWLSSSCLSTSSPLCVFLCSDFLFLQGCQSYWISATLVAQMVKNLLCLQWRRYGFDPWVRKVPWRRAWQPIPVFLPGESHGQRLQSMGSQRVRHNWSNLAGTSQWNTQQPHRV